MAISPPAAAPAILNFKPPSSASSRARPSAEASASANNVSGRGEQSSQDSSSSFESMVRQMQGRSDDDRPKPASNAAAATASSASSNDAKSSTAPVSQTAPVSDAATLPPDNLPAATPQALLSAQLPQTSVAATDVTRTSKSAPPASAKKPASSDSAPSPVLVAALPAVEPPKEALPFALRTESVDPQSAAGQAASSAAQSAPTQIVAPPTDLALQVNIRFGSAHDNPAHDATPNQLHPRATAGEPAKTTEPLNALVSAAPVPSDPAAAILSAIGARNGSASPRPEAPQTASPRAKTDTAATPSAAPNRSEDEDTPVVAIQSPGPLTTVSRRLNEEAPEPVPGPATHTGAAAPDAAPSLAPSLTHQVSAAAAPSAPEQLNRPAASAPAPQRQNPAPAPAEYYAEPATKDPNAAQPLRSVNLEFSPDNAGDVRLRLSERAGEVHISVHSTDPAVRGRLHEGINDLVGSLSKAGYDADAWTPNPGGQDHRRQREDTPPPARKGPSSAGADDFSGMLQEPTQEVI